MRRRKSLDPADPVDLPKSRHGLSVEFQDVSLEFSGQQVIKNLSFTAEAGKVTGIVGPSGAGKSSIFNLIARIVDPNAGAIRIGGRDISQLKMAQLRDNIAVVAQDSAIFDESIRDNIMFGNASASDSEFDQAAQARHVRSLSAKRETGLTRFAARGAHSCRAGKDSASPLREPSSVTRRFCCWTSRPRLWTWNPKG